MGFIFQSQIIPNCSLLPGQLEKKKRKELVLQLAAAELAAGGAWQQPDGYVEFVTEGHVLLGL